MRIKNTLALGVQVVLSSVGLRLSRSTPTRVRGFDPILDIAAILKQQETPTIVDVGANRGEMVSLFLRAFPKARIIAFEPYWPCYEMLKSKFASAPTVTIEHAALGSSPGRQRLNVFSGDNMNSFLELATGPDSTIHEKFVSTGVEETVVHTLDSFCDRHQISAVDILKIDTQGFDLHVLQGAAGMLSQRRVGVVILEINFVPMYVGQPNFIEIHGLLCALGYRLVGLYNEARSNGYIEWCDACYTLA